MGWQWRNPERNGVGEDLHDAHQTTAISAFAGDMAHGHHALLPLVQVKIILVDFSEATFVTFDFQVSRMVKRTTSKSMASRQVMIRFFLNFRRPAGTGENYSSKSQYCLPILFAIFFSGDFVSKTVGMAGRCNKEPRSAKERRALKSVVPKSKNRSKAPNLQFFQPMNYKLCCWGLGFLVGGLCVAVPGLSLHTRFKDHIEVGMAPQTVKLLIEFCEQIVSTNQFSLGFFLHLGVKGRSWCQTDYRWLSRFAQALCSALTMSLTCNGFVLGVLNLEENITANALFGQTQRIPWVYNAIKWT